MLDRIHDFYYWQALPRVRRAMLVRAASEMEAEAGHRLYRPKNKACRLIYRLMNARVFSTPDHPRKRLCGS